PEQAVREAERVAALGHDAQVERALAGGAAAPERLEEDVVAPLDPEDQHEEQALGDARERVERRRARDRHDDARDEPDARAHERVEEVRERAARGAGDLVAEADVLRRLDLGRRVERLAKRFSLAHRSLGGGARSWAARAPPWSPPSCRASS